MSDAGAADVVAPSDTGAGDTATEGSSGDAATDASTDGAIVCNAVVNRAAESTTSTVKGAAPAATGGVIADGTYFQTQLNVYDPMGMASAPAPSGLKVTLVIAGTLMQSVQELPDGSIQTFSESFTLSGTALNRTLSCPKAAPDLKAVYSVMGSTLVIYETDPSSSLVAGSVYAKQ
jgi:hypothetical protein